MKLRKLLTCLFASILVIGISNTHSYAAQLTNDSIEGIAVLVDTGAQATEESVFEGKEVVEDTQSKDSDKIEEESKKENKKDKENNKKSKEVKSKAKSTKKNYTEAELRLLSTLIFCEAGSEPYAGKLAVGIVVMNRVESSRFPNSIKSVIYQKSQFGPARNGSLSRALNRYDNGKFTSENEKACIKAAKEALSGTKTVTYRDKKINMKNYLFFSGRVSGAKLQIANHQFK